MAGVSDTSFGEGLFRRRAGICLALFLAAACSGSAEKRLTGLSFEPAPPDVVDAGTTLQLSVVGTYDDGSSSDLSAAVAWTASDPGVARVAPGGLLEAGSAGPVTVTAEASGVSATASLRVAGLAMLDVELLDAPTGVSAYLDGPAAVLDGRGAAIVAYGMGPSGRTLVTRTAGTEWPAAWGESDDGISDSWQTSAPDVELAANSAGVVGMLYRRTTDGLNGSNLSYGIAYHGTTWQWRAPMQGEVTWPFDEGTPSIAVDLDGTLFVGYRSCADTYPLDELSVARFDANGLVDVKTWSEYVTQVYVAADGTGQVMVLNEWTGSRLYDGQAWGALEPLSQRASPGARLFLADDGTATLFDLDAAVWVHHRDASGWSPAENLSGEASPWSAAAVADGAGRAVAAWSVPAAGGGFEIVARVFNGSTWSAAEVLDSTAPPTGGVGTSLTKVRVVTDGAGRYVVLWYRGYTQRAAWFDGEWHTAVSLAPGGVFEPQAMMRPDGKLVLISDRDEYNALFATTYALLP